MFHHFSDCCFLLFGWFLVCMPWSHGSPVGSGLDDRDVAFMQRLRNLAQEALTWPHLGQKQRLVWAAVVELDAVPLQE